MRRFLLLTITVLLSHYLPDLADCRNAQTGQQLGGDKLPNPEDYSAGSNGKNKSKLAPIVTVPSEPGTESQYRCVL
jgi:hypothetical protein